MQGIRRAVIVGISCAVRELVVVGEGVGAHGDVAHARVVGQGHRERWGLRALLAALLQDQAHGVGVRHAARQGLVDGRLQLVAP